MHGTTVEKNISLMHVHGLFKIYLLLTFKKYVKFVKILFYFFYCAFSLRTTMVFCGTLVGKLGCSVMRVFGLL
jgi:hypothetical protein